MDVAQILIDGEWRKANGTTSFHATNPATGETIASPFPVSEWSDCDIALTAAAHAARELREVVPERIAAFLEAYASNIESAAEAIVATAHEETGLPASPRLKDVELPRTTNQLRQAAMAAREESWKRPTLDLERNIRSCFAPIGPVIVFGPNNFPFAFNGISGGDFAAAIASGNPVIAKAHPLHPNTTRLLAEEARKASRLDDDTGELFHVRRIDHLIPCSCAHNNRFRKPPFYRSIFAAVGQVVAGKIEDDLHTAVGQNPFAAMRDAGCATVP